MSIQTMLFDQDYVSEMYDNELLEEGKKQGIEIGIEQGTAFVLRKLVKEGILKEEEAKKHLEE